MERRKISRANVSLPDAVCRLWAPRYADPPALCKARVAELGWDPGSANFRRAQQAHDEAPKTGMPNNVLSRAAGSLHDGLRQKLWMDHEARDTPTPAPCLRCQACWFEPTRPDLAGRMWFLLPFVAVDNRLPAVFCFALGPPDSSGRGFCARFSTLSGLDSIRSSRCWFKPTAGARVAFRQDRGGQPRK
jgi:hypothetical protein